MGLALCAGCFLIAYAPAAALLLLYASRRSALLLLTIISAFVWLLSLFATSIVWVAIPPLKTVHPFTLIVGVLCQEAARLGLVYAYDRAEKASERFVSRGGARPFNDLSSGIACGLGFGAMHTVMMYGGMLGAAAGDAAYYLDTCPQISMFVWTAVVALLYHALHIALMIVSIEAHRRRALWMRAVPWVAHSAFALLSLLNGSSGGCVINLPLMAVLVVAAAMLVALLERSPTYTARTQIRAWAMLTEGGATSAASAPVSAPPAEATRPAARGLRNRVAASNAAVI